MTYCFEKLVTSSLNLKMFLQPDLEKWTATDMPGNEVALFW